MSLYVHVPVLVSRSKARLVHATSPCTIYQARLCARLIYVTHSCSFIQVPVAASVHGLKVVAILVLLTYSLLCSLLQIFARDSQSFLSSPQLVVVIDVLPSYCQNGGQCSHSAFDSSCQNITTRRSSPQLYTCKCPTGYWGQYCERNTSTTTAVQGEMIGRVLSI